MQQQDLRRKALKMRRVELDLTQMRLARAAAMTLNRYWLIENGETVPDLKERQAIARVLKAKPSQLFPELVMA